jgi:hypothetical protein
MQDVERCDPSREPSDPFHGVLGLLKGRRVGRHSFAGATQAGIPLEKADRVRVVPTHH